MSAAPCAGIIRLTYQKLDVVFDGTGRRSIFNLKS